MKLVLICYSAALQQETLDALARAGVASYTQWPQTLGVGEAGGAHLDTPVWPGFNGAIAAVVDDAKKDDLLREIRALRAARREEGIKAFVLPVDEAT